MTESSSKEPTQSSSNDVFRLPTQTAPTWEVELLISAASLFSLLMLPPLLDHASYQAQAYLGEPLQLFVTLTYLYSKVIVYGLVLTFGVHLVLRAAWVSTLGLRSVYPEGIRWDQLRVGPLYRAFAKRHEVSLEATVERVDNAASVVFACGTLLAILSAAIMLASMLIALIEAGVSYLIFAGLAPRWFSMSLIVLVLGPTVIAGVVDRRYGRRLNPDGWTARAILAGYRIWHATGFGQIVNPLMMTISSQIGPRRFNFLLGLMLYTLMAIVAVENLIDDDRLNLSQSHALDAVNAEYELRSAHYGSTREGSETYGTEPYIADPVVEGSYLRVMIPYDAEAMREPLLRQCPDLVKPGAQASAEQRSSYDVSLLDCLSALYQPRIDDHQSTPIRLDVATDPASGLRAFAGFLDVRRLNRGRHLLLINRPLSADEQQSTQQHWQIPFYR